MKFRRWTAQIRMGLRRAIRLRSVRFLLGAVALALLLEVGLNVAGFFVYRPIRTEMQKADDFSEDDFVILCVGDSHVYGIECDRSLTWPKQLAALLQEAYPHRRLHAINLGVPGRNSSEALASMQDALARYAGRIDLVFFEAGRNNALSFRKASILPADFEDLPWHEQARFLLTNSKAYRLGQLAELRIRAALEIQSQSLFQMNLSKEFLTQWLTRDYRDANRIAREQGIPIFFLNYVIPGDLVNGYVSGTLEKLGREEGIDFVDIENYRLPGAAFFTMPVMSTSDGHPNERGNRVIANILAETVRSHPEVRRALDEPSPAEAGGEPDGETHGDSGPARP